MNSLSGEMRRICDVINLDSAAKELLANRVRIIAETGNFDNWIICSDGPHIAALRKHGITVIALNTPRNISPAALLVYFVKLIRVLRKERFDLVHTHGSIPGLLGRLAVRMAGTSVLVHTVHGYHFHDNMNRIKAWGFVQVEKLGAFFCDLILCQNYQDADETVRFGIARASKVRYVGNGIDLRTFDAPVRDTGASDKVVIGCIARLEPVKNHLLLFSSIELLRTQAERPFQVWLLGDGHMRKKYESMVSDMGLNQYISFLGYRDDVPQLLAGVDIAVLSSIKEGSPRALLEPMAMGIPVVATDVKGNREIVEDGETGFLVPLDSPQEMATRLAMLIANTQLRRQMGAKGQVFVREQFDESTIAKRLVSIYSELLGREGASSRAKYEGS